MKHVMAHVAFTVSPLWFRERWQVFRVAALAAQFLEPAKAQQIFALEASRI